MIECCSNDDTAIQENTFKRMFSFTSGKNHGYYQLGWDEPIIDGDRFASKEFSTYQRHNDDDGSRCIIEKSARCVADTYTYFDGPKFISHQDDGDW